MLELGWRPEIPEHLPEDYKSFVRQCWEEDRKKVRRPDARWLPVCGAAMVRPAEPRFNKHIAPSKDMPSAHRQCSAMPWRCDGLARLGR